MPRRYILPDLLPPVEAIGLMDGRIARQFEYSAGKFAQKTIEGNKPPLQAMAEIAGQDNAEVFKCVRKAVDEGDAAKVKQIAGKVLYDFTQTQVVNSQQQDGTYGGLFLQGCQSSRTLEEIKENMKECSLFLGGVPIEKIQELAERTYQQFSESKDLPILL